MLRVPRMTSKILLTIKVSQVDFENTDFHGRRIARAESSDGCQLTRAFDILKRIGA